LPRSLRHEEPGATYHVTAHAVDGGAVAQDDDDRLALVNLAAISASRCRWDCLAFCVMDTHYHLLVTTPKPNLATGMQFLNGRYAQLFNRRHGRRGHLFRERYYSGRVVADGHLLLTMRYIALNPVIVHLAAEPAAYPWSSYAGVIGTTPCWKFIARDTVLEHFGAMPEAVGRLRALVEGDQRL
jgi:REP element-mobilizing transposase RayT